MREVQVLEALEEVAKRLGIPLRRESFRGDGGLCRLRGESIIIINRSRTPAEQLRILARGLSEVDLDGVFIPPAARAMIDLCRHDSPPDSARLAG
jgi:GGDEF domain-containing protein